MMEGFRTSPPQAIDGSAVVEMLDYDMQTGKNLLSGETWNLQLPKSNVLQFITADGSKISARPSGTEPKIKFYFSVHTTLVSKEVYDDTFTGLDQKIQRIIKDMSLA